MDKRIFMMDITDYYGYWFKKDLRIIMDIDLKKDLRIIMDIDLKGLTDYYGYWFKGLTDYYGPEYVHKRYVLTYGLS